MITETEKNVQEKNIQSIQENIQSIQDRIRVLEIV